MSDQALMREAARCRRLAAQATDPKLAAMLETIAQEYEGRTFAAAQSEPVSREQTAILARRA